MFTMSGEESGGVWIWMIDAKRAQRAKLCVCVSTKLMMPIAT